MNTLLKTVSLFILLLPISLFGQVKMDSLNKRAGLNFAVNIGGIVPLYSKSVFDSDSEDILKSLNVTKKGGFSIGASFDLPSDQTDHFLMQFGLNYLYSTQHLQYSKEKSDHFGTNTENGNYTLSRSEIMASILPQLLIGKKTEISFGLGPYYSMPLYTTTRGNIESSHHLMKNDSLSPAGFSITYETNTLKDNEIKKALKVKNNFGLCFSLGVKIPCKKKEVIFMLKVYQSPKNFVNIPTIRRYQTSINNSYPIF